MSLCLQIPYSPNECQLLTTGAIFSYGVGFVRSNQELLSPPLAK